MGLLDDAIREHLELKRRHGADDEEVSRKEAEAFGPVRRERSEPVPGADAPEAEHADAPEADATEIIQPAELAGEPEAIEREPSDDTAVHPVPESFDPGVEDEPELREPVGDEPASHEPAFHEPAATAPAEPDVFEPVAPEPEPEPVEPEAAAPAEAEVFEPPPREPDTELWAPDLDEDPEPPDPAPRRGDTPPQGFPRVAPEAEGDDEGEDDVLEETPDFLQDSPEHDRLWFEQAPPRDFDFDD